MTRRSVSHVTIALALLLFGASFAASPLTPAHPLQEPDRLTALEQELSLLKTQVAQVNTDLAEARKLLTECTTYLGAQAAGAKTLATSLDDVEAAGFTAGQNFQSRELLLAGLRAWIDGQQEGLPGKKDEAADAAAPKRP